MRRLAILLWLSSVVLACGDDGPATVPGPRPGFDGSGVAGAGRSGSAGGAGAASSTAGAGGSEIAGGAGGSEIAAGAGGSESVGGAGGQGGDTPPADAAAINAFLQTRAYRAWPSEKTDHASAGPHGGTVKVFLNPTLDASFAAGNATHPSGSIAVKELYQNGTPSGFAYSAKLSADSAGGDEWYWYEVFTDAPASSAPYAAKGVGLCKNCHAGGGRDFVLISYPLE